MERWFPPNPTLLASPLNENISGNGAIPSARLICFHGSGSDASLFTSTGTKKRPLPNPLITFCVENNIQLLAVHLPGRTSRLNEKPAPSIAAIAEITVDFLRPFLSAPPKSPLGSADVPLVVIGHSLGCFLAYEFTCLLRQQKLPLPRHLVLSCMVAPDLPLHERPWRPVSSLDSEALKQECRGWATNEEVFLPDMWQMYESILRNDFQLIDDYSLSSQNRPSLNGGSTFGFKASSKPSSSSSPTTTTTGSPFSMGSSSNHSSRVSFHAPLGITTTVFYAKEDAKVTEAKVKGWKTVILGSDLFNSSPFGTFNNTSFRCLQIDGTHNFFYDKDARLQWMQYVIEILDRILIDVEYL